MNNPILDSILQKLEKCLKENTYLSLETETIEFKDLSTGNNWVSLKESINAFLNSHSGIIITGVKERGKQYFLSGYIENNEQNYLNLRNAFTDDNNNSMDVTDYINFEIRDLLDRRIKIIYVDELPDDQKYILFNGEAFKRKSTSDVRILKNKIEDHKLYKAEELLSRKEIAPIKNSSISDLSVAKLNDFVHWLNKDIKIQNLFAENDIEGIKSFLYKKYFLNKENATTLGLLVCGNDPSHYLGFRCEVDCFVDSTYLVTQNKKVITDTVIPLMEESYRFVNNNIEVGVGIEKSGEKITEYPIRVIRESLNNALAHRDYSINKNISITLRPNKEIEIKNPGRFREKLVISIDEQNTVIRRIIPGNPSAHNPRLASILKVFDKWEGKGYGMATLINSCFENKIDVPYYKISLDEIALVIPKGGLLDDRSKFWLKSFQNYLTTKNGRELNDEEKRVLVYLYKSEKLNRTEKYTLLLTSDNDLYNVIVTLLPSGLIYKSQEAHELYSIYLINRDLIKSSFDSELLKLYGTDFSFLPQYYKKALNIIYRYSYFNKEPITAKAVADELYLDEMSGSSYTTFVRKISSYCSKMSSNQPNMLVKSKGYSINFSYNPKTTLF